MKVFLDTNVYVAEALLGEAAQRIIDATLLGRWRIYVSAYVVDEVEHVLVDDLKFSRRVAAVAQRRIIRRSTLVESKSTALVPQDPKDSPICRRR